MSSFAIMITILVAKLELMEHLSKDLEDIKTLPKYHEAVFGPIFGKLDLPEGTTNWPHAWKMEIVDCVMSNKEQTDIDIKMAVSNLIVQQRYIERWHKMYEVFGVLRKIPVTVVEHMQIPEDWKRKQRQWDQHITKQQPVHGKETNQKGCSGGGMV